jgi:predicted outer membrane repeat protein
MAPPPPSNNCPVAIDGTVITGNSATEGGGAVFFVSNDRTGTLRIEHSRLRGNPNAGFHTAGYPGVFFKGRGTPLVIASTLS